MAGIVDFNCDCGPYAFREYPQTTAEEVAQELQRWGISRMIMGSIRAITFCSPQPANELFAAELASCTRALAPEAVLAAAVLNPAYPGAERDLERCAELGFRALKLYPSYHDFVLNSYETIKLTDKAAEWGWPVLIAVRVEDERHHHPLMKVPPLPLEQAIAFARNTPAANVVLCTATALEITNFLENVSRDNVFAEISYVKSPLNAIEDLVSRVGHERLLFGSHAPFSYVQTAVAKVGEACIAQEQKEAIFWGNARRLLAS